MLALMWTKRDTPPLLVGLQAGTTTLEISMADPHKIGQYTTWGHNYITHVIYHPGDAPMYNKDTCFSMFIASLFIITRSWMKNPDVPQQRNRYRNWGTFTQWDTTQLLKTMIIGKWMDLEGISLSEVTQSQKNTHDIHSLIIDICPESQSTQGTIHKPHETQ